MDILFGNNWILNGSPTGLRFLFANGEAAGYGLDLTNERYFVDRVRKSFADAVTFSRASTATMVDSDGVLKWAPHNLLTYSEQFDNAAWVTAGGSFTITANASTAPDGMNTADRLAATAANSIRWQTYVPSAGQVFSSGIWIKRVSGTGDVDVTADGSNFITVDLSSGEWVFAPVSDYTATAGTKAVGVRIATSGDAIDVWGAHLYRSDLGGMVDDPATGNSYVPTTSSAVYLPRRGHHVYNGDTWVNKGLLHESEARTNLVTYSEDFKATGWAETGSTMTSAGTTVSPDGSLVTSWSFGDMALYGDFGTTLAVTYTGSIWIKANKSATIGLRVASTYALDTVGIDVTTEWKRFNVSNLGDGVAPIRLLIDNRSSQGWYTSGLELAFYGAQLEAGSTPSSYIPTSGATVTRAAETLVAPSANLPWPEPEVIGEELVTNGGFDTDSDWTKGTGWTISGGVATKAVGTGDAITQAASLVAGSVYMVTFEVSGATAGVCGPIITAGVQLTGPLSGANGTRTVYLVAPSAPTGYGVTANATFDGSIDNISVKEINPLSVSIQMQGEMTYADEDDLEVVNWRWYEDANNSLQSYVGSTSGTGDQRFLSRNAGVSDVVLSNGSYYSPGVNVPFNIASRHGSTFINGAVDGTALTENDTPTALPDLSSTDLQIGYDFMGTISEFRVWAADLGDAGIEEASDG